ncbi:hypothetical protein GYMLUDRAFT_62091 [Collybiopsis luxurians FD-317 M1]|uniref:Unplaced genomic scaffold GYMLUscaffold_51, whole genome shotgun sequence n=1 Tax=Collybiopsis luxurians FD-317 M1 TaxID=944289 RepID=A0A0D0CDU0_9AGAR|nr:hypothetical protein GYMLUDRAFT_62091 [Collybiopsis luxurians FD-317 M1]
MTATPLQVGNGMSLRGNPDAHPAAPVMPAPKWSSMEVQVEKQCRSEDKVAKTVARQSAISRTAELKDRMLLDEVAANKVANSPPTIVQVKKTSPKNQVSRLI